MSHSTGRCILGHEEREETIIIVPPSDKPTEIVVGLARIVNGCKARISFQADESVKFVRRDAKDKQGPNYRGVETDPT